jgi:hypothetical protein
METVNRKGQDCINNSHPWYKRLISLVFIAILISFCVFCFDFNQIILFLLEKKLIDNVTIDFPLHYHGNTNQISK